jgi:hypothetical protein
MMKGIPQSRIILYLLIAGLIPVVFALFYISSQLSEVEDLSNSLALVENQAFIREKKQALNMTVREHFKGADHFYVDKHLETQNFLEPETESLQKLVNNRYFAGDESVRKRLEFVTGTENSLLFSESNVQAYPFFQETTATLVHPVEVNVADLKKILTLIEGQPIGNNEPGPDRPQIIILDFKIDKKEASENNEVFLLNMKILKREYL